MKRTFNRFFLKLYHLVLKPIRIFCIHQVGVTYDPISCFECDWIDIVDFKQKVLDLRREGWTFISLEAAYNRIRKDKVRLKKYAVLTADDGYRSQLSILSWLTEREIPITLFLNAQYLDGKSYATYIMERAKGFLPGMKDNELADNLYISYDDLLQIKDNSFVSIASHGFEYIDATNISINEFHYQIVKNVEILQEFSSFCPFHAYTWGRHSVETDALLHSFRLIPVLMDGRLNYNCPCVLHRENLLD